MYERVVVYAADFAEPSDTPAYHTPCDTFPSDRGCCRSAGASPLLRARGPHTKDSPLADSTRRPSSPKTLAPPHAERPPRVRSSDRAGRTSPRYSLDLLIV